MLNRNLLLSLEKINKNLINYQNPDIENKTFYQSVFASTCKVRGNLIEQGGIASLRSQ
jgi:hypothetical protein